MFKFLGLLLTCSALVKCALAAPMTNHTITLAPHPVPFSSSPTLAPPIPFTLKRTNGQFRCQQNCKALEFSPPPEMQKPTPNIMERYISHPTQIPSEEQLIPLTLLAQTPCNTILEKWRYSLYATLCCYRSPHLCCYCISCTNFAECCLT
jgi:hypothetical protein